MGSWTATAVAAVTDRATAVAVHDPIGLVLTAAVYGTLLLYVARVRAGRAALVPAAPVLGRAGGV